MTVAPSPAGVLGGCMGPGWDQVAAGGSSCDRAAEQQHAGRWMGTDSEQFSASPPAPEVCCSLPEHLG